MNAKRCGGRLAALSCLLLCGLGGGCNHGPAPAATPAAPAAEKPRAESDLARTTISRAARESLGLETTKVRVEMVQEHRTLTGWITVRPGAEVIVTAPVSGYIRVPAAPAEPPAPGIDVRKGQALFRLEPVLAPLEQTQLAALRRGIEGDLARAREDVSLAESELKRVEDLFKQKLRGERDVEQARNQFKKAREDLSAADDKLKVIAPPGTAKGDFQPAPMTLTAPSAGIALAVPVSPGQFVAAAAPLVMIADLSRPWVRVAVPEYDLPRVDLDQPALVSVSPEGITRRGSTPAGTVVRLRGKREARVPQVDLLKHTADLFYSLEPLSGAEALPTNLVKDQMVTVQVPIGARAQEAVVPYAAVVFDAYGGSWVYVDRTRDKDAETCVYERVRIELGAPLGHEVAVRGALKADEPVVSDGAAALFSREFYRPPVPVPQAPGGKK